jgi:glycosyltransferase involved in cell wall biosynthesis
MNYYFKHNIGILQVVGAIAGGGVGTWLLNMLPQLHRQGITCDFLVYQPEPMEIREQIEAHGGKILVAPSPYQPLALARRLLQILRNGPPYDVIHSHVHTYSGIILCIAAVAGVPHRLAHSHMDTSVFPEYRGGLWRTFYVILMRGLINRCRTAGLACSRQAARDLFGEGWEKQGVNLLYCGIDLSLFEREVDREAVRRELGIPGEAFVIGHVGRFVEQKNHQFIVKIATEVIKQEPAAMFLLIGDGELRPAIEAQVEAAGLSDRFVFTGIRADVPRLLKGAMDVFLLPSLFEGLPISVLEAQAAGRLCIISDTITPEVGVIPSLVRYVPLSAAPGKWARAVLEARDQIHGVSQEEALRFMAASHFNIEVSARELAKIYEGTGASL